MKDTTSSIQDFVSKILVLTMISSGLLLFAGEIRLAALKKASRGSSKLSAFTERMTKTKVKLKTSRGSL